MGKSVHGNSLFVSYLDKIVGNVYSWRDYCEVDLHQLHKEIALNGNESGQGYIPSMTYD